MVGGWLRARALAEGSSAASAVSLRVRPPPRAPACHRDHPPAAARPPLWLLQDELARKRLEVEHEKRRQEAAELVSMQAESQRQVEAQKAAVAQQIEAERRATEKYKAQVGGCGWVFLWVLAAGWPWCWLLQVAVGAVGDVRAGAGCNS